MSKLIGVRFPEDVAAELNAAADRRGVSVSAIIIERCRRDDGKAALAVDPSDSPADKTVVHIRSGRRVGRTAATEKALAQVARAGVKVMRGTELLKAQDRLQFGPTRAAPGALHIEKRYKKTKPLASA